MEINKIEDIIDNKDKWHLAIVKSINSNKSLMAIHLPIVIHDSYDINEYVCVTCEFYCVEIHNTHKNPKIRVSKPTSIKKSKLLEFALSTFNEYTRYDNFTVRRLEKTKSKAIAKALKQKKNIIKVAYSIVAGEAL